MNTLIERLEELSEDAVRESHSYSGISNELSEYYLGYSEGIAEAIELINKHKNELEYWEQVDLDREEE